MRLLYCKITYLSKWGNSVSIMWVDTHTINCFCNGCIMRPSGVYIKKSPLNKTLGTNLHFPVFVFLHTNQTVTYK